MVFAIYITATHSLTPVSHYLKKKKNLQLCQRRLPINHFTKIPWPDDENILAKEMTNIQNYQTIEGKKQTNIFLLYFYRINRKLLLTVCLVWLCKSLSLNTNGALRLNFCHSLSQCKQTQFAKYIFFYIVL